MSLNILYITNRSPLPIEDGQSSRTFNLLKRIGEKENVTLLAMYENERQIAKNNLELLDAVCKKTILVKSPKKSGLIAVGIRILFSLFSKWPYTIWRHYSLAFIREIKRQQKKEGFDIVHCDNLPIAYVHAHIDGTKAILTDHDVSYLKVKRIADSCKNPFLRLFLRYEALKTKMYEKEILRKFNWTIAVSDHDKKKLKTLNPNANIVSVENGVDTSVFKYVKGREIPDTLIWVGGFRQIPNEEAVYHFIKNCYTDIKKNHKNIRLILIGSSPSRRINEKIQKDESIEHHEYVENIQDFLEKGSVFIAPILSGSGTKLKILEAMAAGKAIVTTEIGCEGIEGDDELHYLVAKNDSEFIDKTLDLLNDGRKREYICENAHRLIQNKYSWDRIIEKIHKLHHEITGSS